MNVLLFVFAMMMTLSILTYSKIQMFAHFSTIRSEYLCLITTKERDAANEIEKENYDNHHGIKDKKLQEEKEGKAEGYRHLNIHTLLNEEKRNPGTLPYHTTVTLFKRLIEILYGGEKFFQNALEENPNLVTDFIEHLMAASDREKNKEHLKRKKDLSKIDLEDKELQNFYAKILNGNTSATEECESKKRLGLPISGYPSLNQFLTLKTDSNKIRISLASPALLLAIFNDEDTVVSVVQARAELIKRVNNVSIDVRKSEKKSASEEFRRRFIDQISSEFDKEMFNFAITTTEP